MFSTKFFALALTWREIFAKTPFQTFLILMLTKKPKSSKNWVRHFLSFSASTRARCKFSNYFVIFSTFSWNLSKNRDIFIKCSFSRILLLVPNTMQFTWQNLSTLNFSFFGFLLSKMARNESKRISISKSGYLINYFSG